MTNLREEMLKAFAFYDGEGVDESYVVDEILKIFEKRIDSLKQEANGMSDYIDAYNKIKTMLK